VLTIPSPWHHLFSVTQAENHGAPKLNFVVFL
jgi:hypothetical protein